MSIMQYSTALTVLEDSTNQFELLSLLRQADPFFAPTSPVEIQLYVKDATGNYVQTGLFSALDPDTLKLDLSLLPNFNGQLSLRVLVTDETGDAYNLDIATTILPVNDAPQGEDSTYVVSGDSYFTIGAEKFGFSDPVEGDAFKSVVITSLPVDGALLLDSVPVSAGQVISVADLMAGKLQYHAPADAGGTFALQFQVQDTGGTLNGGVDTDPVANLMSFVVPPPIPATIGDFVWEDKNGNGVQDAGEGGIANVTVNLRDAAGNVVQTAVTDAAGKYSFSVLPGTYSIAVEKPLGYEVATLNAPGGNSNNDSDIDASGVSAAVSVTAGQNQLGLDAGFYRPVSLGDRVWIDTNRDGLQDAGDTNDGVTMSGIRVSLIDPTTGMVVTSTTTDANGNYLFADLKPGVYVVEVDQLTLPPGYSFTIPNAGNDDDLRDSDVDQVSGQTEWIVLESGQPQMKWDAGLVANPASIAGKVLADTDNNNTGDVPLAGVEVKLYDSVGVLLTTTLTDANGEYRFEGLAPGKYTVTQTNLANYLDVADQDGGDPNVVSVNLLAGQDMADVDFIDEEAATIGNRIWEDANGNGLQDAGESGLAGVGVSLKDAAGTVVKTTTTDANGNYSFTVAPGEYSVAVALPSGYVATTQNVAGDPAADSDINASGTTALFSVQAGASQLDIDAGLFKTVSLGDRLWVDTNRDGVQDAGEAGLSGVKVTLLDANGVSTGLTTTTDANGNYQFAGLQPGTYSVQFDKSTLPAGYVFTTANAGSDDALDSDVDATGRSASVTLASGESADSLDAGVVQDFGKIGGKVLADTNNDNAGDIGLSGVTLSLKNAAGVVIATTTTDADGNYVFNDVLPGNYTVVQTNLSGYLDVADKDGGNLNEVSVTLNGGQSILDNNFVDEQAASIGNHVWEDCNNNGIQDAGEEAAAGVTVKLLDASGQVMQTVVTDTNGDYVFKNLSAGDYAVQVVAPTGFGFGKQNQGADDSKDSDVGANGITAVTTLTAGENDMSVDAALIHNPVTLTYDFSGNSCTTGANGNTRTYTVDGVSVTASAWSEDKCSGAWAKAYLGAYSGGHGVTDSSCNDSHTIDNSGRNNYVVYQFSQEVTLDKAFLGYVECDSDIQVWIGSSSTPITSMNSNVLANLGYSEVNSTTSSCARWADVNAGNHAGNVIIIAADTTDMSPEDYFKIQKLVVSAVPGCEEPVPAKASLGDRVWEDMNANGIQDAGESGIAGVTVKLFNSAGSLVATTTTDANGNYLFKDLAVGDYRVQVVAPCGYYYTAQNQGANDAVDSDVDCNGKTVLTTLTAGENDLSWDAGLYRAASIGNRVWIDSNKNGLQDNCEDGLWNVKVMLEDDRGCVVATTYTDCNGYYKFCDIDPGSYRIAFDKSCAWSGWSSAKYWNWTQANVGSNDSIDADAYNASCTGIARTAYTTLVSGECDNTWDAGVTPIVIDLDGNGIQTVSLANSAGAFDVLGTGKAIHSGWISSGDAFLAIDLDKNGKIDGLSELFGGTSKGTGFAKLAAFDSNGDGSVNAADARFDELVVWKDANGNHQTDAGELISLSSAGVSSLATAFNELPAIDAQGNLHLERSSATLADGTVVDMTDVYFNVSVQDAADAGITLPSLSSLLGNDQSLDGLLGGMAVSAPAADCVDVAPVVSLEPLIAVQDQQYQLLAA